MTDQIHQAKSAMRKNIRAALAAMTEEQRHEASVSACTRLIGLDAFTSAQVVMLYMPMANEVDLTSAAVRCFRRGQTVCVPRVDWKRDEIEPVEEMSLDDHIMDCDEHGVRVPKHCSPVILSSIDAIVVPGLAFDSQGNRLGRGGGHYDRFLAKIKPTVTTIGLVFDQQIVDNVPTKPHDRAVDIVVTDRRVTQARASRTQA